MNKVVIVNDSSVARGGATALALALALALRAAGQRVAFVCGDDGNEVLARAGVEVVSLGDRKLLAKARGRALVEGLHNPRCAALAQWIDENDEPDTVYHLHNWAQILSPSVFWALRRVRARCVLHAHDFALACPALTFLDSATGRACHRTPMSPACLAAACDKRSGLQKAWRVGRLAWQRTLWDVREGPARIVVVSHPMREYFLRAGFSPDVIAVIPNPVEPFTAARVEAEKNREILFVGRIAPEKGVVSVVRAAAAVGLRVRLVGQGPLAAQVLGMGDHVAVEPWADRAGLARFASNARLLVSPSTCPDTYGMTFMEAVLSGLPAVVSDMSLLAPEIAARGFGWAVDGEAALEARLRRLARDDGAVEAASRAGFAARGAAALTTASWARAIRDVYEGLLGGATLRAGNFDAALVGAWRQA